jgi:hypothetical protein
MNGSALRQATFAVITAAYVGFWIVIFWPSLFVAIQTGDVGSVRPLAIMLGLGVAVALLVPMPGSRGGVRRWITIGLLAVVLGVAAFGWIGLGAIQHPWTT